MIAGRVDATHAVLCIYRLVDEPRSRVGALMRGGIEYIGWTQDTDVLANSFDQFASLMAGLAGKTTLEQHYPRPSDRINEKAEAVKPLPTLAEFDWDAFNRKMYPS